jgi:hypothetical protein
MAEMNAVTIIHGLITNKDNVTLPALFITSSSIIKSRVAVVDMFVVQFH